MPWFPVALSLLRYGFTVKETVNVQGKLHGERVNRINVYTKCLLSLVSWYMLGM
jgi:hypothetical protein